MNKLTKKEENTVKKLTSFESDSPEEVMEAVIEQLHKDWKAGAEEMTIIPHFPIEKKNHGLGIESTFYGVKEHVRVGEFSV